MGHHENGTTSALNFDDAVIALGFSSGFPKQPKLVSSPLLRALREAGTRHLYLDTASTAQARQTLGAGDGRVLAEVDGNTINQPLLAKVIRSYLEDSAPRMWLEALRRHRPDLEDTDRAALLYTIALARAGSDMVTELGGQRAWEVSLQLPMWGVGETGRPIQWGRYLRAMVPSCLVKVPFAPHAPECFLVARDLEHEGIPVNFTSTFSARQVAAAAILGDVTRANVFMGRLDQGFQAKRLGIHVDLEAQRLLQRLRNEQGVTTQLIIASLRDWCSIVQTAGCDVYTVPGQVLADLLEQDEIGPEDISSELETSYEDQLGIAEAVEARLGRERIERFWKVEPEFIEFLLAYRASEDYRMERSGEAIAHRFESAGFGDFFYAPSREELDALRRDKIPDLGSPLTGRAALDTLYSLSADADFLKHQENIDREIKKKCEEAA